MAAPAAATPIAMDGDHLKILMEGLASTAITTMLQQQQQGMQGGGHGGHGGRDAGKPRLSASGWENLETYSGGEEKWMAWAWNAKVATGGNGWCY